MPFLLEILRRAALDLLRPRVLAVLALPMLIALSVWGGLYWVFGDSWLASLTAFVAAAPLPDWLGAAAAAWLVTFGVFFLLLLLLLPAVYLSAALITSLWLMPALVEVVGRGRFADLARRRGGSFFGSLGNGLFALAIYLPLWLVSLPLWLLGPAGFAASLLLNAWLNRRLFLYDALAEHADARELAFLHRRDGGSAYLLAALLALLHFVPVLNLFAPVYMGLSFAHYGLARLDALRKSSIP